MIAPRSNLFPIFLSSCIKTRWNTMPYFEIRNFTQSNTQFHNFVSKKKKATTTITTTTITTTTRRRRIRTGIKLQENNSNETDDCLESKLVEKMFANNPQQKTKQEKMVESILRVKSWNLRQRTEENNKDKKMSKNKQFKKILVLPEIVAEIMSFGEVRNRRNKSLRNRMNALENSKEKSKNLTNIKFLQSIEEENDDENHLEQEEFEEEYDDEDEMDDIYSEYNTIEKRKFKLKNELIEKEEPEFNNPIIEAQRIRKEILNKRRIIEKHMQREIERKHKQLISSKKERRKLMEFQKENHFLKLPKPDRMCPEHVNWVFDHTMNKIGSAKSATDFVKFTKLPQIAFAGRSNVGKSSLINAVTRRKAMKTSDRPGETREIIFYNVGKIFTVVDLPGYGFAFASPEQIAKWNDLMKEYFKSGANSQMPRMIYLLIDSRHGLKNSDYEMIELFERYQVSYQLVLTKTDTLFVENLARIVYQLRQGYKEFILKLINEGKITASKKPSDYENVKLLMVSSQSQSGIAALKEHIVNQIGFQEQKYQRYIKKSIVQYL
jgi:ribosome biogenesis GTP-binding protein YsxC/EngB